MHACIFGLIGVSLARRTVQASLNMGIRDSVLLVYSTNELCTATPSDEMRGGQSPQPHYSLGRSSIIDNRR